MIDRSETDISYFIDVLEFIENIFSDTFRGDSFFVCCPFTLKFVNNSFDLIDIDTSFITSCHDTTLNFGSIVHFFVSASFCDEEIYEFHPFESGISGFTFFAFTSSTDGSSIFSDSGIDHFCVEISAFETAHEKMISNISLKT